MRTRSPAPAGRLLVLLAALPVVLGASLLESPATSPAYAGPARAVSTPDLSGVTGVSAKHRERPAVIGRRTIGRTVQGRKIKAWHLGRPHAKPTVVVMSTLHGNERAPRRILRTLRDGKPIKGIDLWVLPTVNRDGASRNSRRNAHGVDLNRNYPVHWKRLYGNYYSGKHPKSERETRSVMRFLNRVDPKYVVSFHQPLHGIDRSSGKTHKLARRLARHLHLPHKKFRCGGKCHGTMTQWFNKRHDGAALTVELGSSPSRHYLTTRGPRGLLHAIGGRR